MRVYTVGADGSFHSHWVALNFRPNRFKFESLKEERKHALLKFGDMNWRTSATSKAMRTSRRREGEGSSSMVVVSPQKNRMLFLNAWQHPSLKLYFGDGGQLESHNQGSVCITNTTIRLPWHIWKYFPYLASQETELRNFFFFFRVVSSTRRTVRTRCSKHKLLSVEMLYWLQSYPTLHLVVCSTEI